MVSSGPASRLCRDTVNVDLVSAFLGRAAVGVHAADRRYDAGEPRPGGEADDHRNLPGGLARLRLVAVFAAHQISAGLVLDVLAPAGPCPTRHPTGQPACRISDCSGSKMPRRLMPS